MKKTLTVGVLSLTLACAASAAQASDEASPGTRKQDQSEKASNAEALRVVRDKETGELRAASAQEAAAMRKLEQNAQKKLNREYKAAAGKTKILDSGAKSMVLDLSHLESVSASVEDDGTVTVYHGDNDVPPAKAELPEE